MENILPKPIELNFKDIRNNRQKYNDDIVYNSIKTNDIETFNKNINKKELERILNRLNTPLESILKKCNDDDDFCNVISMSISKKSSRQGSKDEIQQIKICNDTFQKCGISIKNLTATELRPTKDGQIISKKEMKTKCILKDQCLKSFDGKITGKINGFITAKVAYGSGGHQDNVFEEMDTIAEWWKTYKCETEEILIILIDTDLDDKIVRIKKKYNDIQNIIVYNHIELQQYIIDKYYVSESM